MEKERGKEGARQKRKDYGSILRQQMCDNEQLRKEFMSEKYKYGREMAEKECIRRKLIEGEMDKKFTDLRFGKSSLKINKTIFKNLNITTFIKYITS